MRLPVIRLFGKTKSTCYFNNQKDFEKFAYLKLDIGLGDLLIIKLPFKCFTDFLYIENKIADIILKFIDNSIVGGK